MDGLTDRPTDRSTDRPTGRPTKPFVDQPLGSGKSLCSPLGVFGCAGASTEILHQGEIEILKLPMIRIVLPVSFFLSQRRLGTHVEYFPSWIAGVYRSGKRNPTLKSRFPIKVYVLSLVHIPGSSMRKACQVWGGECRTLAYNISLFGITLCLQLKPSESLYSKLLSLVVHHGSFYQELQ